MAQVEACGGDLQRAISLYRDWLNGAVKPLQHVARFNLGHLLSQVGELAAAEAQYRSAIAEFPGFVQAYLNLGSVLERQGRVDEALAAWRQALALAEGQAQPDVAMQTHALNHLGRVLEQQHRYDEAETMMARSLAIKPTQDDVLHHWVHLRQKQCRWPVFEALPGIDVATERRAASALAMLSASGDPAEQLDTARRFAAAKIPSDLPPLAPPRGYRHERLRIGYLSSNLNLHAVTILTAEVYELHDRARFEVYGLCWSPEDGTPMRARIRRAMDHLVRIDQLDDEAAAQAIRAAEIDVLIDLQGLTSGCRPRILAHRPAPVQVSWLGFPGTSAIPGVDYIIADHYLIPEAERVHYSEVPIYLPECFQSNDRQRAVSPAPTRTECGLPDDAMVYCAFNHNHKFNSEVFGLWMEILAAVPDSVLWLLADNPPAQRNLTAFAQAHGVAPERLVFAPRVVPERYLARFKAADLFLDTLPFNGGTTVSDALWAGLPVLTRSGRTFAGRMAGSLLRAAGLPELVTMTASDYRELAVALARDRKRLDSLRARLEDGRTTCALFDTPRLVRHLESALTERVRLNEAA
jgi:predicted O-linked N-acetylglucosamine transferase (SPINDLY family)